MRRSTPRTASSLPNRFVRPDVSTAQSTPGPAWGLARPAWFTEESLQVSQDVVGRLSRRERPVGDQPALRLSADPQVRLPVRQAGSLWPAMEPSPGHALAPVAPAGRGES